MPAPLSNLLFVYGSLRSDASRDRLSARNAFRRLKARADLECRASVAGSLFAVSWFPAYVDAGKGRVSGELWRISGNAVLAGLDAYEGPDFVRERRRAMTEDGRRVTAWIYRYVGRLAGVSRIASGDYLEWAMKRSA